MPDVSLPAAPTNTAVETIAVDERVVACDGGGGALGHPRVWLRIITDHTMCPYCSRVFVLRNPAGGGHDH